MCPWEPAIAPSTCTWRIRPTSHGYNCEGLSSAPACDFDPATLASSMDAAPIIARVAEVLERHGLEAILIGNAAAALHGAPVTTVDIDFLIRATPRNLAKLKVFAVELGAVIL